MSGRLRLVMCLRVSTAGQVDGYGLAAQERDCRRWNKSAAEGGHRIVHTVRDKGITGKSVITEREELMEAVGWVKEGRADGLLAPNLDRLARELTVQEAVLSYVWALGGRVFTADHGEHLEDDETDPMRTAMRQMRGVFAQLERGLIRKRLIDGREAKAAAGGYAYGAPRYGQRAVGGELREDEQAEAVRLLMCSWRWGEGLSLRAIVGRLEEQQIRPPRGGRWHPATVARLTDAAARERDAAQSARRRAEEKEQKRRDRASRVLQSQ